MSSKPAGGRAPAAPLSRLANKAHAASADLARLLRHFERDLHSQYSRRVMSGMMGLLVLCEYLSGKDDPAQRLFHRLHATNERQTFAPRVALHAFGAKPLSPAEAPGLYALLLNICARAGMRRAPELYLLPVPDMNAFALGGPDNACIAVTQGLLRGLSRAEVAGILAHEVAHIVNRDAGALNWAAAVESKIASLALSAVAEMAQRRPDQASASRQSMVLASTPAIARLLYLAFSRVRELDADALALDLIDDPGALAAALRKLEHFHTGLSPLGAYLRRDTLSRLLHSHPDTWERIARIG